MRSAAIVLLLGLVLACGGCERVLPFGARGDFSREATAGDRNGDRVSVPDRAGSLEPAILDRSLPKDHNSSDYPSKDGPSADHPSGDKSKPKLDKPGAKDQPIEDQAIKDTAKTASDGFPCGAYSLGWTCIENSVGTACSGKCSCYATCQGVQLTCNVAGGSVVQCTMQAGTGSPKACNVNIGLGCPACKVVFQSCWPPSS